MKKRKLFIVVLSNNTPTTPSVEAQAEAASHFTLNVQNAGSGQT